MADDRKRWYVEIFAIVLASAFHAGIEYVVLSFVLPIILLIYSVARDNSILTYISVSVIFCLISCYVTWVFTQWYHQKKDRRIASQFSDLHDTFRPFEQIILQTLFLLSCRQIDLDVSKQLENIASEHTNYLANICMTAAVVLGAKKGRKVPLSANIKSIHINDKREKLYSFLVSSSKDGTPRSEYEGTLLNKETRVDSNYMYRRMFDESIIRTFYHCNDLKQIFKEMQKDGEVVAEPNSHTEKLYKSCLVYPIFGNKITKNSENSRKNVFGGKELILYKDKEVFGLLCVDSMKRGAFNLGYDLAVMRQLTSYAFESFRMVRAVQETIEHLSKEK